MIEQYQYPRLLQGACWKVNTCWNSGLIVRFVIRTYRQILKKREYALMSVRSVQIVWSMFLRMSAPIVAVALKNGRSDQPLHTEKG